MFNRIQQTFDLRRKRFYGWLNTAPTVWLHRWKYFWPCSTIQLCKKKRNFFAWVTVQRQFPGASKTVEGVLLLLSCSVVSDSMRPHRRQPTRLRRPWDSPGKNTGVGCHFLLQCMKVKTESEVTESCPTLSDSMDCSPLGSTVHGIFQARVLEWVAIAFSVVCLKGY